MINNEKELREVCERCKIKASVKNLIFEKNF